MAKTFLILGGYGNTGRLIARLLLQESDVHVVLAGRSLERAAAEVAALDAAFGAGRASARRVDAADRSSVAVALAGVDLVVVASSTAEHVETVARAAIDAGIDYLDVQYSTAKLAKLRALQSEIEQAGLCFITDGGFHPGLPAALVRYAAGQLDRLESARVGSVIKIDWASLDLSPATVQELTGELLDFQMASYRDGRWQTQWTGYQRFDFGPPFGPQGCAAMMLEEMWSLPDVIPSLRETGFFVGGFNWFADWVAMPLGMAALKLAPQHGLRPAGNLLAWSLRNWSRPPYGTVLQLEANGRQQGRPAGLRIRLAHADGYVLTAVPVVACLLQYLDGQIRQTGLHFQAHLVEPTRLLHDMARMGIAVQTEQTTSPQTGDITVTKQVASKKDWNELAPQKQLTISLVGLVQVALLGAALIDIRRRPAEQIKGSKKLWTLVAFINFVGPITYFVFGRKRSEGN
jgi:saccharopine dehydrogenase (NAD+, L-lysine-forming)